jgi:cellulose synthase/poly-beta-1,6-N-acetylglucosamine synthase-like glycosyltransferase
MRINFLFWLRAAAILQLLTGAIHALGFVIQQEPSNDTERQLMELMSTYRLDMAPFHPTMQHLMEALSSCFTFLYFLGGFTILFLSGKGLSPETWKGLTGIQVLIFGAAFLVMLLLTFLPPIIITGLVFVALCLAYATNHIHHIRLPKD